MVFPRRFLRAALHNPPLMVVVSFLLVIALGTALLLLPVSREKPVAFVDALFMATSAVCVTGLATVDPAATFTFTGEFFLITLVQLGGLGVLTLSVFVIALATGRIGFARSGWIEETLTSSTGSELKSFLKRLVGFVAATEACGAVILFVAFLDRFPLGTAAWAGIFHAVSAFCNAGFSLFPNNLESFPGSPLVNAVVMLLIILGGIGFIVVDELMSIARAPRPTLALRRLSFHTRVVLATTGFLLVSGTAAFLLVENGRRFSSLDPMTRIFVAVFQSVTCRTAGFSTIPTADLSAATLFTMMLLMFIGGSPGSTAGGIKTTSFAVFASLIIARLRGRPGPELFGRTVSRASLERVVTILVVSALVLSISVFLLLITEGGGGDAGGRFLAVVFEAVSAFGTVGLSVSFTPLLTGAGKIVICALMFLGRVGPLTLAILLLQLRRETEISCPEEEIMVG
jgi:trk system potassium uptake protein TrkH